MTVRRKSEPEAFASAHGETVREFFGAAFGPAGARHSLAQITLAPGKASLPHRHPAAEESYFFLSGRGRMVIDGQESPLGPGDAVFIAPGRGHRIYNDGEEDLIFIAVCVPPWTPECSVFTE